VTSSVDLYSLGVTFGELAEWVPAGDGLFVHGLDLVSALSTVGVGVQIARFWWVRVWYCEAPTSLWDMPWRRSNRHRTRSRA
jgi:hypothetical protein